MAAVVWQQQQLENSSFLAALGPDPEATAGEALEAPETAAGEGMKAMSL